MVDLAGKLQDEHWKGLGWFGYQPRPSAFKVNKTLDLLESQDPLIGSQANAQWLLFLINQLF
jgi:hypothetical protein